MDAVEVRFQVKEGIVRSKFLLAGLHGFESVFLVWPHWILLLCRLFVQVRCHLPTLVLGLFDGPVCADFAYNWCIQQLRWCLA